jgi:hypothetical protein
MLRRSTRRAGLALGLGLGLPACGGAHESVQAPSAAPAPAAAARPRAAPGHLARGDVDHVLALGPPWLLRRVLMEEVVRDGKFVGWRIVALPEEWKSVDLKPGDVVTKVNGAVIEKPDDLWSVWTSLTKATELRVAYERDGAPRELAMPIDGAPSKTAVINQTGAPPPRAPSKPKSTIVIEEDNPPDAPE